RLRSRHRGPPREQLEPLVPIPAPALGVGDGPELPRHAFIVEGIAAAPAGIDLEQGPGRDEHQGARAPVGPEVLHGGRLDVPARPGATGPRTDRRSSTRAAWMSGRVTTPRCHVGAMRSGATYS